LHSQHQTAPTPHAKANDDGDKVGFENAEPIAAKHLRNIFKGPVVAEGHWYKEVSERPSASRRLFIGIMEQQTHA
jgi:hypothetical protein